MNIGLIIREIIAETDDRTIEITFAQMTTATALLLRLLQ